MRHADEIEAAYFVLLRAREECEHLKRFEEYLGDEVRRLRRFIAETRAHGDSVAPALRRRLEHTQRPLQEALESRIATCVDELSRMEARIAAAAAFVEESERHHDALRAG